MTREHLRRLTDSRVLTGALLFVLGVAALFIAREGVNNHTLQADEFTFNLYGTRTFNKDFFGTLFATSPVNRGPERLTALVLLLPDHLFSNTADMFRAAHVLMGLIWASTALPAYGLARQLGIARPPALLAAALTVVTPWMIYGATLLNVVVATPLLIALLWAIVRSALRPSVGADVLVLVLAVLSATARAGHLPFIAVAALVIPLQVWRDRPRDERPADAARRYPARLLKAHPVLVVFGVIALVGVVKVGALAIVGGQYRGAIPQNVTFSSLVQRTNLWGAMLAQGTGYIPLIIGLPWLLRQAFRPTARAAGTFAVMALATMVVYVVSTMQAPPEERYIAPLAALPAIAFVAAIVRREATLIGTAIASVFVGHAVKTWGVINDSGPFSWMVAPARQFFSRVLLGRLSGKPLAEGHEATIVLLLFALAALALVFICSRRWRGGAWAGVTLAVAGSVLLTAGAAEARYNTKRWQQGEGHVNWTWEQRAFIDLATGNQRSVGWDYNPDLSEVVPYAMGQATAYNRHFAGVMRLSGMPGTFDCCSSEATVSYSPDSPRVKSNRPLPEYELEPPGFKIVGFEGPVVARSPAIDLYALRRIGPRPRFSYVGERIATDGGMRSGRVAVIHRFRAGPGCMQVVLAGHPSRPTRFRIEGMGGRRRVTLKPFESRLVKLRLSGPGEVRFSATGPSFEFGGRRVAGRLADLTLEC